MTNENNDNKRGSTRRDFLKTTTAATVGSTLAVHIPTLAGAHAAGNDEIRVGLIGCGGRGTGAIGNVMESAPGVKLVAMGDAFKDRLEESKANLSKKYADKMDVPAERCFVGFVIIKTRPLTGGLPPGLSSFSSLNYCYIISIL